MYIRQNSDFAHYQNVVKTRRVNYAAKVALCDRLVSQVENLIDDYDPASLREIVTLLSELRSNVRTLQLDDRGSFNRIVRDLTEQLREIRNND